MCVDSTCTDIQELLVEKREQVKINKKPSPIITKLLQPTDKCDRP